MKRMIQPLKLLQFGILFLAIAQSSCTTLEDLTAGQPEILPPASEDLIAVTADASVPGDEPVVEPLEPVKPEIRVDSSSRSKSVWIVDANSDRKLGKVYSAASEQLSAKMSSDQKWVVVSDLAFSDLERIHLLKAGEDYSYVKIDRDRLDGPLWDQFVAELDPTLIVTSNKTTFEGWSRDGKAMKLKLAALPRGGDWIEKSYTVSLTGL